MFRTQCPWGSHFLEPGSTRGPSATSVYRAPELGQSERRSSLCGENSQTLKMEAIFLSLKTFLRPRKRVYKTRYAEQWNLTRLWKVKIQDVLRRSCPVVTL